MKGENMANITMIGCGSWGVALSCLLCGNGHAVRAWEYNAARAEELQSTRRSPLLPGAVLPADVLVTNDMAEACAGADMVFVAVPSGAMRATMERLAPLLPAGMVAVCVSKGLENGTLLRLSEVMEDAAPQCRAAVLSGPSHAEEVVRGLPTTVVAASRHDGVPELVQECMLADAFRVYTNADIVGVELGGALKNVIALAAGLSDGLGYGDNTKAALMTRGMAEIARLGAAMGAELATFAGLSGIGDLIVTCTSMHSRNRRAGILLGQGKPLDEVLAEVGMVVEGIHTARAAYELARKNGVDMPIIAEINRVLFEGKNPRRAVADLMTRDRRDERVLDDLRFGAAGGGA